MSAANSDSEAVETGTLARLRAKCDATMADVAENLRWFNHERDIRAPLTVAEVRALLDIAEAAQQEAEHQIDAFFPGNIIRCTCGERIVLERWGTHSQRALAALSVLDQEAQ